MRLAAWVAARVLGSVLAALCVVGGLVGLATGVEQGHQGWAAALSEALRVVPITLVWLAPLCCGVGTAVAMARIMSRGEDVALSSAGLGPLRTGWTAALAGVLLGLCAWWTADTIVPRTMPESSQSSWVWIDGGAYRVADAVWVGTKGGQIDQVQRLRVFDEEQLQRARQLATPRLASAGVLASAQTPAAKVERQGRFARILACAALSLLGWIPIVRRATAQVGLILAAGLCAQAVDVVLHALAAQGHISVMVGAWSIPVLLALLAGLSSRS